MTDSKSGVNDLAAQRLLTMFRQQAGTVPPLNWQSEPGLTDGELAFLADAWLEASNCQRLLTDYADEFSHEHLAAISGYVAGIRRCMDLLRRKCRT